MSRMVAPLLPALRALAGIVVVATWASACSLGVSGNTTCESNVDCAIGSRCDDRRCMTMAYADSSAPDDDGIRVDDGGAAVVDGGNALDDDGGRQSDAGAAIDSDAGGADDGGADDDAGAPDAGTVPVDAGNAVDAGPQPPVVSFGADFDPAIVDEDVVLRWTATGATSCTLFDVQRAVEGATQVPRPCPARYEITCDGPGGSTTETTDVGVVCPIFGAVTIEGDVVITSASDLAAISPQVTDGFGDRRCFRINGDLTITASDITSLQDLYGLTNVTGGVLIQGAANLTDIRDLCLLDYIGTDLEIANNAKLESIRAFGRLFAYPTGEDDNPGISIHGNDVLTSLFRFDAVAPTSFCAEVYENNLLSLTEFTAFDQSLPIFATQTDQSNCP